MLQSMRDGASSWFMKFVFSALLVLATAGLVLMDMGGFFRSGPPLAVAFTVEGQEFSTVELDRMVSQTLRNRNLTLEQGLQEGIIQEIINREVDSRILNVETRDLGVRIPDSVVAEKARALMSTIMGVFQQSDQDVDEAAVFRQFVNNLGMTESMYVASEKNKIATELVSNALTKASFTPSNLVDALIAFDQEERIAQTYDLIIKDKDIRKPSDEDLMAFYEIAKESYATPEYRRFSFVTLSLEEVTKELEVSEDLILDEYDLRMRNGDYIIPESRKLAQASLPDFETADKVYKATQDGKDLRAALREVTGSTDSYVVPEDYTRDALTAELADVAFNAEVSTITEPVETPLGWFVMRIDAANDESNRPLEDVRDEITTDIKFELSADALFELGNSFEDSIAGGLNLIEAADEMNLPVVEWHMIDAIGRPQASKEKAFDDKALVGSESVLEAVFETNEGETSPLVENENGDFIVVYVDEVITSEIPAFEDLKETVTKDWRSQERARLAREKAESLMVELQDTPKAVSFKTRKKALRPLQHVTEDGDDTKKETTDKSGLSEIERIALFQIEDINGVTTLPIYNGQRLIRLKEIVLSTPKDDDLIEKRGAYVRTFKENVLSDYYAKLRNKIDVDVNNDVIDQFYKLRLEQNY